MGKICQVCGKNNLSNMGSHVRKAHDMNIEEYNEYVRVNSEPDSTNDESVSESETNEVVSPEDIIEEFEQMKDDAKENSVAVNTDEIGFGEDNILNDDEPQVDLEPQNEFKPEITPTEMHKKIFNHVERKDPDRPLSEFCEECDLTEGELINIVRKYLNIGEIPIREQIKHRATRATKEAAVLVKRNSPSLNVTKSEVAQCLIEEYGYTCVEVRRPGKMGISPKTWVLKKSI